MRLIVFIALLATLLTVQAPAWLLSNRIAAQSNGWLELRNPVGTIWNGNADAVVPAAGSTGAAIALGRVAWHVVRIDWSRRALVVDIEQSPPAPHRARLTAGLDRLEFSGGVRAPAAVATHLPQFAGWSLGGSLSAESDTIESSNTARSGAASVQWHNASVAPPDLPESIALGDVAARITLDPAGIAVTLSNSGGNVELSGSLDPRTGRVNAQLEPRANVTPAQVAWLQSHLPPPSAGKYALSFALDRH